MFIKSVITLFLLVSSPLAFAHGTGESFEASVDGYRIDIGYNVEEFKTRQPVLFDFGIETSSEYNVEYTDVWVRVTKDQKTVYAGGIFNSDFGGARMTYTFPEAGEYQLSVRYQNGNEKIVSTEFPIKVISGPKETAGSPNVNLLSILFGILGIGVGYGLASFIRKK